MPRREPPQQPAPVQRLRICYSKLGVARFASHRDFARAFERALRRAGVPMAYSFGFSPHPRISYAGSAPTSAQSCAEYLDIALARRCDPARIADDLNGTLPQGFRIRRVVEASRPRLGELLEASRWWIDLGSVDELVLRSAVISLLAAESVPVTRTRHHDDRVVDVRPAIVTMGIEPRPLDCGRATSPVEVVVTLRHVVPLVRPGDVLAALRLLSPGLGDDHPGLFTRQCQGPLAADGSIGDPLEICG